MARTGIGYDVHQLVEGESLIIGGVEIPSKFGSKGHSDGDGLIHAVLDALLGAAALGDIEVTGFSSDNLSAMVEKVTSGATTALGNISMTGYSSDNLSSMVEKVTSGATGALGKIQMSGYDSADLTSMVEKVTAGATASLGKIKMTGYDASAFRG